LPGAGFLKGALAPLVTLFGWWLGIATCYLGLARMYDLRATPGGAIIILLTAGFVYALACWWLHRKWSQLSAPTARSMVVAIILGAILFRIVLLAVPPTLSDDIYRYRWDGRVQDAGFNPYAEPPASPLLASVRDPLWLRINYPEIRTIYGPLAQQLFALTYRLDGSLIGFQAMAVVGDLLCMLLLLACLRSWGLPTWRVALYAWSPLAAVESASNGHFDSWPTAAVLLAVWAGIAGKGVLASAALSAGVLFKTWPLLWAPFALRRRPLWHAGLFGGLIVLGYLPFRDAGLGLLQPWLDYSGRWLFNDAGFFVLRTLTGSQPLAKGLAAAILLAAFSHFWRRHEDPLRANYWLLLLAIFLMPTIHPWYLLWPLPLAAAALDLGWLTVTVLAPLSYWILVGAGPDPNAWTEPTWVRFAIWLPALAVGVWQARSMGIAAPGAAPAAGPPERVMR